MFCERKVAQAAAYLLHKASGRMPHMKLMKLMYLADREALGAHNSTISGDRLYSMRMGPVLSQTLDMMGGSFECDWGEWITPVMAGWRVGLQKEVAVKDLDELSEAEMDILQSVHNRFGDWDMNKLIAYTHTLKEWRDVGMGSSPIAPKDIFESMGKDKDEIRARLLQLEEDAEIDAALASLGTCR